MCLHLLTFKQRYYHFFVLVENDTAFFGIDGFSRVTIIGLKRILIRLGGIVLWNSCQDVEFWDVLESVIIQGEENENQNSRA